VTPGGFHVTGNYLYQLSDRDWFDGVASVTFGSGGAACFFDRSDAFICEHGLADGFSFEISANVRHYFDAQGMFRPFAHGGIGAGFARFAGDSVSGFMLPAHGGGGVRVAVAPEVAIVALGDVALGIGWYSRGVGTQAVFGASVIAGVEFPLR
jgi:hypothetical protein